MKNSKQQLALPMFLVTTLVLLLVVGLRQRQGQSQEMVQPILGGSEHLREGPWPECVGMVANNCQRLIETYAEDVRGNIQIVPQDAMVTMDFRPERVRIFVDESELVTQTPRRG